MPNCSVSIPKWETEGRPLSGVDTNVSFNMIKNDTLYFELSNTQTVYLYFNLSFTGSSPSYMVSIYDANTYNLVTTLTSSLNSLSTNIDLFAGTYIVCLRSIAGTFRGTARADYYGFGRVVTLNPIAVESQQAVDFDLTTKPRPKPCDKDIMWRIIEGKLPPGLEMNPSTGLIYGRLPYLDCINDKSDPMDIIPSSNLFFTSGLDEYQTIEPWGRRWNFKLRISVVEQPQHFEERWFCINIYNNWTRSQQKFLDEYENGVKEGKVIRKVEKPNYKMELCENPCLNNKLTPNITNNIERVNDNEDILEINILGNIDQYNTLNIVSNVDSIMNSNNIIVDNQDNKITYGAFNTYHSTIEMDEDIISQSNVYVSEDYEGVISDELMIPISDYSEFVGFRQYAINAIKDENSNLYEYRDNATFNAFLNLDKDIKYEYISSLYEDDDINEQVEKHFIYIYFNYQSLSEVEKIEKLIAQQKQNGPWSLFNVVGETVFFDFERGGSIFNGA